MGNRCLVVFHDEDKAEISPTVYLHWSPEPTALIGAIKTHMKDREGDVHYTVANFCFIARKALGENDNMSLGCWNTSEDIETAIRDNDQKTLQKYSQGDEGVYIVNCNDFTYKNYK